MDVVINLHEVQDREGCKGQESEHDFRPMNSTEGKLLKNHGGDRSHDAYHEGDDQEDDLPRYDFHQSMYLTYTPHCSEARLTTY